MRNMSPLVSLITCVLLVFCTDLYAQSTPREGVRWYDSSGAIETPSICDDKETVIYFSNGVKTELTGAKLDKDKLKEVLKDHLINNNLQSVFGPYRMANAYNETYGNFGLDVVKNVIPQAISLNRAQLRRWVLGVNENAPPEVVEALERELAVAEVAAIRNSPAAEAHAAGYIAALGLGRTNVVVGHSYGTILANISYLGLSDYEKPGHVIVQTALMDNTISGADRFNYPLPFTTINEDVVAFIFPFADPIGNKLANVENYPGDQIGFPVGLLDPITGNPDPLREPGGNGHGFRDFYLDTSAPGVNGQQNSVEKIMSDIVAMHLRAVPRPCRGFMIGGVNDLEDDTFQLSKSNMGDYVKHLSSSVTDLTGTSPYPQKHIDWKGFYDAGEATRVLTYFGPAARYNGPSIYTGQIFRNGLLAYRSPEAVLGAAIQRDAAGKEWIIAATSIDANPSFVDKVDTVTFYRRDAALFDFDSSIKDSNNPNGWESVGSITLPLGKVTGPWFFNQYGTEASTLRRVATSYKFETRRPPDPVCVQSPVSPFCDAGGPGTEAADGFYAVDRNDVFTVTISNSPGVVSSPAGYSETGASGVLAVDYDANGRILLREVNTEPARGFLKDPDIAANKLSWLKIDNTPLTSNGVLECSVDGSFVCRNTINLGTSSILGGFAVVLGANTELLLKNRTSYHVFYADIRTGTIAFSKQEGSSAAEYWLVHDGNKTLMGTAVGSKQSAQFAGSTRYGYEGSFWSTGPNEIERDDITGNVVDAKKVNPILGIMNTDERVFSEIIAKPPEYFGIEVGVDGSVLASVKLPGDLYFNYHSQIGNLQSFISRDLSSSTLLPMALR